MRSNYLSKQIKSFFIILIGVFLLTSVPAGAAQYKIANLFSYDDEPSKGITVGSYFIDYRDNKLTASKIVNGKKVSTTVLDTHCVLLEHIFILTNGKTVYYCKRLSGYRTGFYRINVNGKGKKKLTTWKGIRPEFHDKVGNVLYFSSISPAKEDGDFFHYLYCYNLKTGKLKMLLKKYKGTPYSYFGSKYLVFVEKRDKESGKSIVIRYYEYSKRKVVKTNVLKNLYDFGNAAYDDTIVGKNLYVPFAIYEDGYDSDATYIMCRIPLTSTKNPVRVFETKGIVYYDLLKGHYIYYTKRLDPYQFFRFNIKTKVTEKLTKKRYVKLTGLPAENYG